MADEEHLQIMLQGADAWNAWRRANPGSKPDLTGASLRGRQLGNLRLASVDLSLSTLKKANLRGSDFWHTVLNLADLSGANLSRSTFGRAHLHATNLSGTELCGTRFIASDLSGADLSHALQFTCFISHSSMDRVFCEKVYGDLQANGVRCWYFSEEFSIGRQIWQQLNQTHHVYDKLLVICSKNSMQSAPVISEIERALDIESNESRNVLFCVTRDDYMLNDWSHPRKEEVQKAVVSDFRHWERPESYERGLDKLLTALKTK
jgi:hypothetical protein